MSLKSQIFWKRNFCEVMVKPDTSGVGGFFTYVNLGFDRSWTYLATYTVTLLPLLASLAKLCMVLARERSIYMLR